MSVWIAETLIATTLLMALVMMLRRPVARWLGAGAAYMLWALPLVRMLMPALPSAVDPSPLHVAVDQAGLAALLDAAPAAAVATATPVPAEAAFPWLEAGITLWFIGMLLFLLVQAMGYARFRRHMLEGATDLGQEGRIRLITSPNASGPLAFGLFHPYIVLPTDFGLRYDAQEQDMAIAHERAHHERGDLIANMVALLLLAVHWCNPVAWLAYRAYRTDQETACDARVLSLYGRESAHAYGRAILKAAGGRQFAAACHLTRVTALKGRLKMLSNHDMSLRRISWGMAAVALVTATGLALTASGTRAAQQMAAITEKVETADFTRLKDLVAQPAAASLPAADAVPAAPASPAAPAAPAVHASSSSHADAWPVAPVAPVAPAADMIAPVPPTPPAPPSVRSEKNRIVVTHADGRVETHAIPTEREIARMVPVVDIREGCDGGREQMTSHREWVDGNGQRHVRVRICNRAIEAQARRAEIQGEAQARLAEAQAKRMEAMADLEAARAERMGKVAARRGLMNARTQILNASLSPSDRDEALRDIDREIAALDRDDD
jgi:bla regulator protein BlaR1